MSRARNRLTATRVKALVTPGRHADGGGLYLRIRPSGSRSWVYNYTANRRRRDVGLGSADDVSLSEARALADRCRDARKAGRDPRSALRSTEGVTFAEAAAALIEVRRVEWRHPKTAYKWERFIDRYARPLKAMDVAQVTRMDVEDTLRPHWRTVNHSARAARAMIEAVLDFAAVKGWREGDNPARWKGNLEFTLSRAKPVVRHNAAVPFEDAPGLYSRLVANPSTGSQCAAFVLLTAARNGEARFAPPDEFDLDAMLWRIPGERMKRGIAHDVPLSDAAADIIASRDLSRPLVFEGYKRRPLSDATVRKAIRSAGFPSATAHGLRSTFRDWCGETGVSRELAELALSHAIGSEVERAYRRRSAVERRRVVMQHWAEYLRGSASTP